MTPTNASGPDKLRILAVEDSRAYQEKLLQALGSDYDLTVLPTAEDGEAWLSQQTRSPPDLLLLDVILPGMDGIAFLARLRANDAFSNLSVIVISSHSEIEEKRRAFLLGVLDFISKPYQEEELQLRVRVHSQATLARKRLAHETHFLEEQIREQSAENLRARDAIILGLSDLAATRDNETGLHLHRTQYYVQTIVEALPEHPELASEVDGMDLDLVVRSAPLHDIGKVGVPDAILHKPGPLTARERKIMQEHTTIGHAVLRKADTTSALRPVLRYASTIALYHHEKWDGSGYPFGISGKSIPIEARVMALADVFDALVTRRVYKPAFSPDTTIKLMREGRGGHFDPRLLDLFLSRSDHFVEYARLHPESVVAGSSKKRRS